MQQQPYPEDVPVEDIKIPKGRRPEDKARVASLAASIGELGLLQPIGLTPDYTLIYGLHRLGAYRCLGLKTIAARIHPLDKLRVEMAEIDENIQRHQLTALELDKAMARRKEIYEALHPQTKAGTAGGKASGDARKRTTDKMSVVPSGATQGDTEFGPDPTPSFASEAAAKTGVTERTVRRAVEIGEAIPDDVAETLHDTAVANNQSQLRELAKLPEDEQRKAAEKIKSGKASTVQQATGTAPAARTYDMAHWANVGRKGVGAALDAAKEIDWLKDEPIPGVTLAEALEAAQKWFVNGKPKDEGAGMEASAKRLERLARAIVGMAERATALKDPHLDEQAVERLASQLRAAAVTVRACKGECECPYCNGKGGRCRTCKGSGWITKTQAQSVKR